MWLFGVSVPSPIWSRMAARSVEHDSRELLVIPWNAIGYIEPVGLDGEPRHRMGKSSERKQTR